MFKRLPDVLIQYLWYLGIRHARKIKKNIKWPGPSELGGVLSERLADFSTLIQPTSRLFVGSRQSEDGLGKYKRLPDEKVWQTFHFVGAPSENRLGKKKVWSPS